MADSTTTAVDRIIGQSLITAEAIARELRERLAQEVSRHWGTLDEPELARIARGILEEIEPILAKRWRPALPPSDRPSLQGGNHGEA